MDKMNELISKVSRMENLKQVTISLKYLNMLYETIKPQMNNDEFDEYTNTFLDLIEHFVNLHSNESKANNKKSNNQRIKCDLVDDFFDYMSDMKDSTKNDYIKRISIICYEENITVDHLAKNIDYYVDRYTVGEKKERGADSHNSYRCALKKFREFVRTVVIY